VGPLDRPAPNADLLAFPVASVDKWARKLLNPALMRSFVLLLAIAFSFTLVANDTRVPWNHFLKVRPWTFEPDEVRYPTLSNIDPSILVQAIGGKEADLGGGERLPLALKWLSQQAHYSPEQRALLLRDLFDQITVLDRKWMAFTSRLSPEHLIFYGAATKRDLKFVLLFSLTSGEIRYRSVACRELLHHRETTADMDLTEWTPVVWR
jgi:hypothetical protein